MKRFSPVAILLLLSSLCDAQKPVNVIFDSDMGPDYDDVGAIAILHAFADSGKANILATIASTNYEGVAAVLSVFNTYFGRPAIPIGVPKKNGLGLHDWQHWSDTVRANYPHAINKNNEVPEAADLYRKILAAQPDHSVTIVTVGFFTNLAALLESSPDSFSKLDGRALVTKKVKQLVSMAAKFPAGKEFNVEEDKVASKKALEHWPTEVIFSGFEIGEKILAGLALAHDSSVIRSPVKDVFRIAIAMSPKEDGAGRKSWDETAVLVAVNGHQPYYTLVTGQIAIDDDGGNTWTNNKKGTQHYLVEKSSYKDVEAVINHMIAHEPMHRQL